MNQETIAQTEWSNISAQHALLMQRGAEATFATLPGFAKAFTATAENFSVFCIDEGCTGFGTHLAGSGCGIPEATLLEELRNANITEFTTHEGCGAWALAHPELTEHAEKEAAVIAWGQGIAAKLGVPHRHITASEMKRPATLHNAFYAIYDTTGSFNRDLVTGMGPGFVTSPKHFPSALSNIELATKIAFGASGFGGKFTVEHPFVLIAILDPSDPRFTKEQVLTELREVQNKFPAGLVVVDSIEL